MGGIRAMPEKKDTTKTIPHSTRRPIKGKVKLKEPQKKTECNIKMGEVEAEPLKKEIAKPEKSNPKK
jgi:hypothetical protein